MPKAFILSQRPPRVQIGNKIFNLTSGKIEPAQANRKGIFQDCECFVEVPGKSLEHARLAIVLIEENRK
jgi:hypothetical protein